MSDTPQSNDVQSSNVESFPRKRRGGRSTPIASRTATLAGGGARSEAAERPARPFEADTPPQTLALASASPFVSASLLGAEQFAQAMRPGLYFPWMAELFRATEQTTSAAPADGETEASVEGPPTLDRIVNAATARVTFGVSPAAMSLAFADWATHLAWAPGKRGVLATKALRKTARLTTYAMRCAADSATPPCIEPLPQDRRFGDACWCKWPYNLMYQSFLLTQQWWHNATTGVRGVDPHHEKVVAFTTRQLLDMMAPSNFLFTNPELMETTAREGGQNLVRGAVNFLEDWERAAAGRPPVGHDAIKVGRDVAVTPGKVVYRNRLIELIQYAPATEDVAAEPILIVPAWIMKYYVLDLSPHNSLVRFLVERGHTVFMISWRNPGAEDRDLSMDDYRRLGVERALETVRAIVPDQKIDAVGYCLGGTLLSIEAAALARNGRDWLNSITLLAAQVDFREPGELGLFIDHSELTFLEDVVWDQGYLDTSQMAGAFQLLRSNDLIWSRVLHHYLFGRRQKIGDLMAWNADATRMPHKMHIEYLRRLYLHNDLAENRYDVDGHTISLSDIRRPMFVVGTETDHVSPWRSVYKVHQLTDTDVTFVLTKGGHNAGIVSEPGHPRRHHRISHRKSSDRFLDPEAFLAINPVEEGSWWPAWQDWLAARSGGRSAPPRMGLEEIGLLADAPGTYVMQK